MLENVPQNKFFDNQIRGDGSLILVVDDDQLIRQMHQEALEAVGYRVVCAQNGAEALQKFVELKPRLVVLDVVMQGMDGYEVCHRLRQEDGGDLVPVLMLTSLEDESSIQKAYAAGATDFLPKPVNGLLLGYRACHILREYSAVNRLYWSELQQLAVFDSIPDPLMIYDNALQIIWANQAAALCFGQEREALIGQTSYGLWRGLKEESPDSLSRRCFNTGETVSGQTVSTDGRIWGVRLFPIRSRDGAVDRAVLLAHDITDKIKLQADTIRNSQLASLGELAAGVAHEINNPISGVINYAQIMINRNSLGDNDLDLVKRIQKEGIRISNIVGSLLNMTRADGDKPGLVEIDLIINDAMTLFETRFHRDGILLHVDLPQNLPPIRVQQQQIQQVIINLISNALHALNDKEFPKNERKLLEITAEEKMFNDQQMLAIHVFDRGTGIPPHAMSRIMHPFFTTKPAGQGTGLGLSISHNIIRDHGGFLTVDSEEGEFTRVTIMLPIERRHKLT